MRNSNFYMSSILTTVASIFLTVSPDSRFQLSDMVWGEKSHSSQAHTGSLWTRKETCMLPSSRARGFKNSRWSTNEGGWGMKVRQLILVVLLFAMLSNVSLAQRTTAIFGGIVQDPTGAVLPGAEAQLVNEGTSASIQRATNETGEFLFDFVPPGTYTLKIVLPGFKTYESRGIP